MDSFVPLCRRGEQRFFVDRFPLLIGQTMDVGGVSIGRWLQRDPIGCPDVTNPLFYNESGQAPGGINLYGYVGGGSVAAVITLPGPYTQQNWNLDGLGNWRSLSFQPTQEVITAVDQLNHNRPNQTAQITVTPPGVTTTLAYDGASGASNGNLANDGTLIYSYDALNRPTQIINEGLVIATYVYDTMNRRVRKTVSNGGLPVNIPDGTTDYIWQGWQVMEERNPFGGSGSIRMVAKCYLTGGINSSIPARRDHSSTTLVGKLKTQRSPKC